MNEGELFTKVVSYKAHIFESSGDAYDACQCSEDVEDGDVIVVPSEKVVGVADTWPIAVTENRGALHTVAPGCSMEDYNKQSVRIGYHVAKAYALGCGFGLWKGDS